MDQPTRGSRGDRYRHMLRSPTRFSESTCRVDFGQNETHFSWLKNYIEGSF